MGRPKGRKIGRTVLLKDFTTLVDSIGVSWRSSSGSSIGVSALSWWDWMSSTSGQWLWRQEDIGRKTRGKTAQLWWVLRLAEENQHDVLEYMKCAKNIYEGFEHHGSSFSFSSFSSFSAVFSSSAFSSSESNSFASKFSLPLSALRVLLLWLFPLPFPLPPLPFRLPPLPFPFPLPFPLPFRPFPFRRSGKASKISGSFIVPTPSNNSGLGNSWYGKGNFWRHSHAPLTIQRSRFSCLLKRKASCLTVCKQTDHEIPLMHSPRHFTPVSAKFGSKAAEDAPYCKMACCANGNTKWAKVVDVNEPDSASLQSRQFFGQTTFKKHPSVFECFGVNFLNKFLLPGFHRNECLPRTLQGCQIWGARTVFSG